MMPSTTRAKASHAINDPPTPMPKTSTLVREHHRVQHQVASRRDLLLLPAGQTPPGPIGRIVALSIFLKNRHFFLVSQSIAMHSGVCKQRCAHSASVSVLGVSKMSP